HEARSAQEVTHERLVPILDAGDVDGRPYLAVAYVAGETLEQRVQRDGALPLEDVLRLADDVSAGLDALHERGLVHRDIKTSNIMLAEDGTAALTDFGLAKGQAYTVLTRPGQVLGTLDYMAPELIRGQPASPLTDVYALACVAFECVTCKPPFPGKERFQIRLAHLDDTPPIPVPQHAELAAAIL